MTSAINSLDELYGAILAGELEQAISITREVIAEGVIPQEIVNEHMIKGMEAIGTRFESGQVLVPNLLVNVRAVRGALDILKPLMQGKADSYIGRIVIGTVKGDLYDIGKNLVASMFEGYGFRVINLGVDVSSDKFTPATLENKADIIRMSALLTTIVSYMKEVIDALETFGLRGKVKVMMGGAPVGDASARSIDADVYTSDINAAVTMAKRLTNAY